MLRSKRKQKRKQPSQPKPDKDLPDPFSALNPEVEAEEENQQYHQDACPCCLDRIAEQELNKEEQAYLDWIK